jgi:hypothetical protein
MIPREASSPTNARPDDGHPSKGPGARSVAGGAPALEAVVVRPGSLVRAEPETGAIELMASPTGQLCFREGQCALATCNSRPDALSFLTLHTVASPAAGCDCICPCGCLLPGAVVCDLHLAPLDLQSARLHIGNSHRLFLFCSMKVRPPPMRLPVWSIVKMPGRARNLP